jgi:lipoate-protein ligase B
VFGRTGLLAAVGLAFRRGVACHGGFLNATPPLDVYHRIDTIPARRHSTGEAAMMGSIEADMQRRVRIQDVRTAVVQGIADAFDMPRIHINAGLPVRIQPPHQPEVISRVG